ncbi:GDSL esterase/lipase At5g55050 [Linum grandiflorum]
MFDVGTNNYLNMSTARADFPPNGVDFPAGPTGRVSNGRNMADYIGNKSLLFNFQFDEMHFVITHIIITN